jgi:hypothetical protein
MSTFPFLYDSSVQSEITPVIFGFTQLTALRRIENICIYPSTQQRLSGLYKVFSAILRRKNRQSQPSVSANTNL